MIDREKIGLVSVVITHFNEPNLLLRSVGSVIAQGDLVNEIIVVDDASTVEPSQKTLDVLSELDHRIKVIKLRTNQGGQRARNIGISHCSAQWVAMLDADDEWLPHKLKKQIEYARRVGADIVACRLLFCASGDLRFDRRRKYDGSPSRYILCKGGHLQTSTFVGRREVMNSLLFDEAVPKYQDWDFMLRAEQAGLKIALLDEFMSIYHLGRVGQMTQGADPVKLARFIDAASARVSGKILPFAYSRLLARAYLDSCEYGKALSAYMKACEQLRRVDLLGAFLLIRRALLLART